MPATTITVQHLIELEQETAKTSLKIRRIRIAAERGDISPEKAVKRLRHLGIIITR